MKAFWIKVLTGGLAGGSATAPMTIFMAHAHRWLPWSQQYALPPREIVEKAAKESHSDVLKNSEGFVTLGSHFGYGAAAGVLYGLLPGTEKHSVSKGLLFAVTVWVVSYFGLLPALKILRPATEHPLGRNVLMFLAHLVWGTFLGLLMETVFRDRPRITGAMAGKSVLPSRDT